MTNKFTIISGSTDPRMLNLDSNALQLRVQEYKLVVDRFICL
jgi:hypothetical protein